MSTTSIPNKTINQLLIKSGGRCQYRGCNKSLYMDIVTKRNFNQSYVAHIIADEPGGPRGDAIRSKLLAQNLLNLMLMCDTHHRLIDKEDEAGHPEPLLLEMKKEHEERIERVTAIDREMKSHILAYRANVGIHTRDIGYPTVSQYLLPEYYPAEPTTIDLSLSNSVERDRDEHFWAMELSNLEKQYNLRLQRSFAKGEISHLSVFAFAPIPLLIKLGTLVNDIYSAEIYQPTRNPEGWKLNNLPSAVSYNVRYPTEIREKIAVNISLSATITDDRITSVLGSDCSIYTITIPKPFNDYLKSKTELIKFSEVVRMLFSEIKVNHGSDKAIHIFPAMPVATAIELGRAWMPKADLPLVIYDQNSAIGGFKKAIDICNL